jgi:DNA-binding transcriptional LysR family regulator
MEMQHVRYFLALSQTLNFTRAAEQSNVSQPALTRAIQQLEYELGGPLFHRERQRTHLSELGRIMLPYFETIQAQSDAARTHAKSLKKLDSATLKIGAMCTIGPKILSDLFIQFGMAHPNVDLEVEDKSAQELLEMLASGKLEMALFGLPEGPDLRFHALPLSRSGSSWRCRPAIAWRPRTWSRAPTCTTRPTSTAPAVRFTISPSASSAPAG